MSTLAAARADNFYFPPGWDPSKGSLNKFQGSHGALGDRARKLASEGILVIRFEMPFNVWCLGCNHLIAKGVRFNAEKKQVGMYHSTRIWSFRMRTPCCQHSIEVQTDPKNAEYLVVAGARRKVETYDAAAAGTQELDPAARDARVSDPLAVLEHGGEDRRRAAATFTQIEALQDDSEAKHRDDYALNKALRRRMRGARKEEQVADARRRQLGLPDSLALLPGTHEDELRASAQTYGAAKFDAAWKHTRRQVACQSIFAQPAVAAAAAAAARGTKRGTPPLGSLASDGGRGGDGGSSGGKGVGKSSSRGGGGGGGGDTFGNFGNLGAKQRRLAPNIKLRLTEPKA